LAAGVPSIGAITVDEAVFLRDLDPDAAELAGW